jgi:general nucleoside transport system permease protein
MSENTDAPVEQPGDTLEDTRLTQEEMTTHDVVERPVDVRPSYATGIVFVVVGLLVVLLMTIWRGPADTTTFRFSDSSDLFKIPDTPIPAWLSAVLFGGIPLVLGALALVRPLAGRLKPLAISAVVLCGILGFLVWCGTGQADTTIDVTGLLTNTLFLAVPLILGAMAGIVSERSGVINVAIEGQMLASAFIAAMVATLVGNLYAGVLGALVTGALVGALLAVFAIRYVVNQVVLGVVINLLVLGLTNYLYSSLMQTDAQKFNNPKVFQPIAIPVLSDIPVVGRLFFTANILVYATYVVVVLVHVLLFHSRWGLRTRAVGEHPQAADTLGIKVNRTRYRNSLWAGALAGLAGAYLTIGSVGEFGANMTAGRGFIALAAVIFGRWTPIGSVGAAMLFAFCTALRTLLSIIGTPVDIPTDLLSMLPYLVTIIVVAGVVGRVRPPAADGIPYVKG